MALLYRMKVVMVQEDQAGVLGLPYKAYIQLLRAFKLLPKVRKP